MVKIGTLQSQIASGDERCFWGQSGSSAWRLWVCHFIPDVRCRQYTPVRTNLSLHYFSHTFIGNAEKQQHSGETFFWRGGSLWGSDPGMTQFGAGGTSASRWLWHSAVLVCFGARQPPDCTSVLVQPMFWSPAAFLARKPLGSPPILFL